MEILIFGFGAGEIKRGRAWTASRAEQAEQGASRRKAVARSEEGRHNPLKMRAGGIGSKWVRQAGLEGAGRVRAGEMSRVRAIKKGGGVSFLFSKSYQRLKSSLFGAGFLDCRGRR